MNKFTSLILLICCGSTFSHISFKSNKYMDAVLYTHLPNEGRYANVDPVKLSNFTSEQTNTVFGMNVKVKMDYYNGEMKGFFRVRRHGDCSPVRRYYEKVAFNCTLVFNDIKVDYDVKMKYGVVPTTTVKATGNISSTYLFVDVAASQMVSNPYLRLSYLPEIGNVETKISGLDPLNESLANVENKAYSRRMVNEFFYVYRNNFLPSLQRACTRITMLKLELDNFEIGNSK